MRQDVATLSLFPDHLFIRKINPEGRIERFNFLDPEKVQVREYGALAAQIICDGKNYGLILATALGKTFIAFLVMDHCLENGKVIFLAPTTSLCEQHLEKARDKFTGLDQNGINLVTGDTQTGGRAELYGKSRIIIGTPQTFLNDLRDDFDRPVTLDGISLIILDEMHLAAKRYAYVEIAERAKIRGIQVLGLTASPGGTKDKIARIKRNLHLDHWLRFSLDDDEIKRFRFPRSEEVIKIPLGDELMVMHDLLFEMMEEIYGRLAEYGYLKDPFPIITEKQLLDIGSTIRGSLAFASEEEKYEVYAAYSLWATYYKLHKALIYLITESFEQFTTFGARLMKQAEGDNRAAARIINDQRFLEAWNKAQNLADQGTLHPKQRELLETVRSRDTREKMLIFCSYIDSNRELTRLLNKNGFRAVSYIGKKQLPTKRQREVIGAFEANRYSAMVATSAGQMGLDIVGVDTVIDYSAPQTGEEMIQRHGRCGRHTKGHIFTLLMDDDLDLHHYYAARSHKRIMALEAEKDSRELKERVFSVGLPRYPVTHASLFSGKASKTELWAKDIKPGATVHERFKVVSGRLKIGRSRGPYVYFKLADKTGIITLFHPAKDVVYAQGIVSHLRSGRVCIVCAEAVDWKGSTVLRVNIRQDQFMVLCPDEDFDPKDYEEPKKEKPWGGDF